MDKIYCLQMGVLPWVVGARGRVAGCTVPTGGAGHDKETIWTVDQGRLPGSTCDRQPAAWSGITEIVGGAQGARKSALYPPLRLLAEPPGQSPTRRRWRMRLRGARP